MLALFLARIELELETPSDSSSLGTLGLVMVLAAVFVVVAGVAGVLTQRRRPSPELLASSSASSPALSRRDVPKGINTILHAKERRRHARRGGNHIKVLVAFQESSEPPVHAEVLDRSRGGLLIALPCAAEAGRFLAVQPPQGPPDLAPVRVEIRHCRQEGERWLAGCKFEQALPLGTLFLFG